MFHIVDSKTEYEPWERGQSKKTSLDHNLWLCACLDELKLGVNAVWAQFEVKSCKLLSDMGIVYPNCQFYSNRVPSGENCKAGFSNKFQWV